MSFNLLKTLTDQIGPDAIKAMSSAFGENPDMIAKGIQGGIPAVAAGLIGAASKPNNKDLFSKALDGIDLDLAGNLAGNLTGANSSSFFGNGTDMLGSLLGNADLGSLVGGISKFSGLSKGSTGSMVSTLGSLALSAIGNQQKSSGLDIGGILGSLVGQKDLIAKAIPAGLGSILGGSGLLKSFGFGDLAKDFMDSGNQAKQKLASAASEASRMAEPKKGNNWTKWLIWILVALAAIWLLMRLFGPDTEKQIERQIENTNQEIDRNVEKASEKIDEAVGYISDLFEVDGVNYGKQTAAFFSDASDLFNGITDVNSAREALPKLNEFSRNLDGISKAYDGFSVEAQTKFQRLVEASMPAYNDAVDNLYQNAEIKNVLSPVMDQITQKLDKFTR